MEDRTFSAHDVLRIFNHHLTAEEQRFVEERFGFPEDINRVLGPARKIALFGEPPLNQAMHVIALLVRTMERMEATFGPDFLVEIDRMRITLTRGADELDTLGREVKALSKLFPGGDGGFAESSMSILREVRGTLRTAAASLSIPRDLVDEIPLLMGIIEGLDDLRAEVVDLHEAIEVVFAADDPF